MKGQKALQVLFSRLLGMEARSVERARSKGGLQGHDITRGLPQPALYHISLFFHTRPFPHGLRW